MEWRLETEAVRLRSVEDEVKPPDVCLAAGDAISIDPQGYPPDAMDAWFDAIMGLAMPAGGRIVIDGRRWDEGSAWDQDLRRGAIRRVYREGGWISNLDILENITLSERHHTRRATGDILREAETWALRLGLPGLPAGRPAHAARRVLRQAQWIRALLGTPRLMLIAANATDDAGVGVEAVQAALAEKQERGAAVVRIGPGAG